MRFELGSDSMKSFSKWFSALAALVLLAGPAVAGDAIAAGRVKGIHADKKEFVLTDSAGKDWTFKLGDTVIINRGGKESQSGLNAGDPVNVCYDKGPLTRTAHYILVQEGGAKNRWLMHGTVKNYDADKKELTFTSQASNWTFPMGDVKVRLNREDSKIGHIKIGDKVARYRRKDRGSHNPGVPDDRAKVTNGAKGPAPTDTVGHPAGPWGSCWRSCWYLWLWGTSPHGL